MLKFSFTPESAGYGSRLWIEIPEDYRENILYRGSELYKAISKLACWGGHDKSGENYIAFEFRGDSVSEAATVLRNSGKYRLTANREWLLS